MAEQCSNKWKKLQENFKADTHQRFCSRGMLQGQFALLVYTKKFALGACSQIVNRFNIVEHFAGWKFCSRE